jgi:HK97 family phage portal protein
MGIMDRLFGSTKTIKKLETQVKALQRSYLGMQINASTAIYPSWQVIESIDQYCTIDDIYSVISYLAETAARIPMYGYEVVNDDMLKRYKKHGQQTIQGKHYQLKAMQDLPDTDPFVEFMGGITYEDRIKYFTILYITGELFLYKEVIELGPNAGKVYLHALNNQNVQVIVSDSFPQRVIGYRYYDVGYDGNFTTDEIIHVKYYNPQTTNGLQFRGLSPLQVLTKRITRLNAGMDASVGQIQNGGIPGIVYEKNEFAIETLAQRKNDFAKYLHNSSNKGAPYFAAGEMGYIPLGLPLADMDVVELQKIDFTKLCNAYKFPEVLLNNTDASTYDNMNTALKMLYTNSILPNIFLFRDAIIHGVLTLPKFMDGVKRTIEIDISEIPALQDDMKAQADALNAMWWITPNEKREIQQFEEIDNPLMNQIIIDSGKQLLIDLNGGVEDMPVFEREQIV